MEVASQLRGVLVSRKLGNVFGSSKRYYRFHDKGRLLVEYANEPKPETEPKEVLNVCEIQDLKEEAYQGDAVNPQPHFVNDKVVA